MAPKQLSRGGRESRCNSFVLDELGTFLALFQQSNSPLRNNKKHCITQAVTFPYLHNCYNLSRFFTQQNPSSWPTRPEPTEIYAQMYSD